MRIAKSIFFAQLLIFLTFTNASGYYFGGLDDYAAAVPSQEEKEPFATSDDTLLTGTIARIVPEDGSLIVATEVPGFFGPQKVMQPVRVGKDSTVNLCYRDTGECKVLGTKGFESIASLSPEELKNASVHIMGYAEDQSRIINIETVKGPA